MGKVAHHGKLATGRGKAERAFEVMKHKQASSLREKSVAAGTCSWYANRLQLVELCCSISNVIDSIRLSMCQYTIIIWLCAERILSTYEVQYLYYM